VDRLATIPAAHERDADPRSCLLGDRIRGILRRVPAPTTYYAKTGFPLGFRISTGWGYTLSFAATLVPSFGSGSLLAKLLGLVVAAAALLHGLTRGTARLLALVALALLGAVLFEGADWMVLHRFWVPLLPILLILICSAARAALERLATRTGSGLTLARAALAAGLLAYVASSAIAGYAIRNGGRGLVVDEAGYRHAHDDIARFLRARALPGDAVALMDVGRIGYRNPRMRVIDITGLTDRQIARTPGGFLSKSYPPRLVLGREPRFLVLVPSYPIDRRIRAHPEFRRKYRLVHRRNHRQQYDPPSEYWLEVYERADADPP
jgi:hypothetical protein